MHVAFEVAFPFLIWPDGCSTNPMSDAGEFQLVEPFDIDDGSLHQCSPEYAFCLGVEWLLFRQQLSTGKPFKTVCLSGNVRRFVALAERHRRFVEDRQTACV